MSLTERLVALLLAGMILGLPLGIIFQIVLSQVPTEFVVCSEGICEQPTSGGWAILAIVWQDQLAVSLDGGCCVGCQEQIGTFSLDQQFQKFFKSHGL